MFAGFASVNDQALETNEQGWVACCVGKIPESIGFAIDLRSQPIDQRRIPSRIGMALKIGGTLVSGTPLIGHIGLALGFQRPPCPYILGGVGMALDIKESPYSYIEEGLGSAIGLGLEPYSVPTTAYTIKGPVGLEIDLRANPAAAAVVTGAIGLQIDARTSPKPAAVVTGFVGLALGVVGDAKPKMAGSVGFEIDARAAANTGYKIVGSVGFKIDVRSLTVIPRSIYYLQSTNLDHTCDASGTNSYDLGASVGTGTQGTITATTTYAQVSTSDISWASPHDGPFDASINVTTLVGTGMTFKFRVEAVNSSCTVIASSAFSADFTTTGVKTLSATLSGTTGANRLRLAIWAKKSAGPPAPLMTITNGSSSFVKYPTA